MPSLPRRRPWIRLGALLAAAVLSLAALSASARAEVQVQPPPGPSQTALSPAAVGLSVDGTAYAAGWSDAAARSVGSAAEMPGDAPSAAATRSAAAAEGDVPDWVWGVIAAICGSAVLLGLAYIVWLRRRPDRPPA